MEYSIFNNNSQSKGSTSIKEDIVKLRGGKQIEKRKCGSGFQESRINNKGKEAKKNPKHPNRERSLIEYVTAW